MSRETLEPQGAVGIEGQARSVDERSRRLRDEDLARPCLGLYSGCLVNRNPSDVVATQLDLRGVETCADIEPALIADLGADLDGTANGLAGVVEGRQRAVARALDPAPAYCVNAAANDRVVAVQ